MKKTIIVLSLIVLAVFLVGCATETTETTEKQVQKTEQKTTTKTICKSGCDYSTIQSAIGSGAKDLKITDKGTYFESVSVNNEGIKLDCQGATIDGEQTSKAFVIDEVGNVEIKNCKIINAGSGFHLVNSNNNKITDNEIRDSAYGIFIRNGNNNEIEGNTIEKVKIPMESENGENNIIKGNVMNNNVNEAIALFSANKTVIENNEINNGLKTGIRNRGEGNIIRNNKVLNNGGVGIECKVKEVVFENNECSGNAQGQCLDCSWDCPNKC